MELSFRTPTSSSHSFHIHCFSRLFYPCFPTSILVQAMIMIVITGIAWPLRAKSFEFSLHSTIQHEFHDDRVRALLRRQKISLCIKVTPCLEILMTLGPGEGPRLWCETSHIFSDSSWNPSQPPQKKDHREKITIMSYIRIESTSYVSVPYME